LFVQAGKVGQTGKTCFQSLALGQVAGHDVRPTRDAVARRNTHFLRESGPVEAAANAADDLLVAAHGVRQLVAQRGPLIVGPQLGQVVPDEFFALAAVGLCRGAVGVGDAAVLEDEQRLGQMLEEVTEALRHGVILARMPDPETP
jgi:hypothetical protein